MKYLSILHTALLFLVFSCDQKETSNSRITIAGQMENPEVDEIEVFIGDELSSFDIHVDGSFLIHFDSDDPKTYAFRADRIFFSLFLSLGDSIHVTTNAKDFKNTFTLSGDKVLENTYLFEKSNFYYDSKEAWIKMVEDKKMGVLQWLAENAWKSEITKHFMVYSIPRFLLLDEEGRIIDPSAKRPSGNIKATLDQYLFNPSAD